VSYVNRLRRQYDLPGGSEESEWIEEKVGIIEEPLLEAYAEAKAADGPAIETLDLSSFSAEELDALWALYALLAGLVHDAVGAAQRRTRSGLSKGDVDGLAPLAFVRALCTYLEKEEASIDRVIWYKVLRETKRWAERRNQAETAGSEQLTRLVRHHIDEYDGLPAEAAAEQIHEEYNACGATVETIAERVRAVRTERHIERLDKPAHEEDGSGGADLTLNDVTPADIGGPLDLRLIGQRLADILGKEDLWNRLSTPTKDRAWSEEELNQLGKKTDRELAAKLNRNLEQTRDLRRALAIDAHSAGSLTRPQVAEIRRQYEEGGTTYADLAEQHGVSSGTISRVINAKPPYNYEIE